MNEKIAGGRARPGWPQRAAILIVMVSIAVVTAACGSGSTSAGSGSSSSPSPASTYAKLLAYAQCMRSHGVPNFPDPSSNGVFNASGIDLQSPQVQSARQACKSLQPPGLSNPGAQAKNAAQALKYAQCMRSHGVPSFPDPSSNGNFNFSKSSGINPQSATYQKAQQDCQSIMPGLPQAGG